MATRPGEADGGEGAWCYMLVCGDGSYYTGWSTDVVRRLKQHQAGRGGRYTRSRLPVRLVYVERLPDRTQARQREAWIKALKRAEKEKLVHAYQAGEDMGERSTKK